LKIEEPEGGRKMPAAQQEAPKEPSVTEDFEDFKI
jgi:hypothetical protein